jgi:hypothetical protein
MDEPVAGVLVVIVTETGHNLRGLVGAIQTQLWQVKPRVKHQCPILTLATHRKSNTGYQYTFTVSE